MSLGRKRLFMVLLSLLAGMSLWAQSAPSILVVKSPYCGCCDLWVDHLRESGFSVRTQDVDDLRSIKEGYGVPASMESCHTAVVGGYVVEGHVPAADIYRLLQEQPAAVGIAVPGMPIGSPGMEIPDTPADPYDVILFQEDGRSEVFSSYR